MYEHICVPSPPGSVTIIIMIMVSIGYSNGVCVSV